MHIMNIHLCIEPLFEPLFGFEPPEGTITNRYLFGTRLVLLNSTGKVYIYDLESEKKLYEIQLDSRAYYSYLGCAGDNSCFYMKTSAERTGKNILRVNLEKGSLETVDITRNDFLTGAGKWEFDTYNCVVSGDYIFYRATNYNSMTSYWFRYSMKDGSCALLALPYFENITNNGYDDPKCLFAQDGTGGILYFDNAIYRADFGSGTVRKVNAEIQGVTIGTRRESDGMFAYYYEGSQEDDSGRELLVCNADGDELWKIDNLAERIIAVKFHGDSLIAAMESKQICVFDARSGKQIGMFELDEQLENSKIQIYDGNSGELIIDDGAGRLFMVDCRNWALTGAAYNVVGYCQELNWIISYPNLEDNTVGYCRCYTVSELVEKGKAFVGEQTMSETDKAKYGLSS